MSRRLWSAADIELLRRLYAHTSTAEIAVRLRCSISRVYRKAHEMGLRKSEAYLASPAACRLRRGDNVGAATRFQPGLVPWNKGTHFAGGGRSADTRFQPGHRGGKALQLYQPIGAERLSEEGYLQRKVNDDFPLQRRWKAVHIIIWEEANGPLPKGHALAFRDGDKTHIALENLELISRAELMRRNSYHTRYPKEIARAIMLRAALNRKINARRKADEQQHD